MALGPRFHAFLPCGSRARLESDIICLMEAYGLSYTDIMSMPCSRRHRLIKMREMIVDAQKNANADSTTLTSSPYRTGLSRQSQNQAAPGTRG